MWYTIHLIIGFRAINIAEHCVYAEERAFLKHFVSDDNDKVWKFAETLVQDYRIKARSKTLVLGNGYNADEVKFLDFGVRRIERSLDVPKYVVEGVDALRFATRTFTFSTAGELKHFIDAESSTTEITVGV